GRCAARLCRRRPPSPRRDDQPRYRVSREVARRAPAHPARLVRESRPHAAEMAHLHRLTPAALEQMVRFEDEAWWREAIGWERSGGVLLLSGHFGNWELLVYAHGMRGHPVHLVHRAIANPLVDRWLNQLRTRAGTHMIRKSRGAEGVLRALRERGFLVLPI